MKVLRKFQKKINQLLYKKDYYLKVINKKIKKIMRRKRMSVLKKIKGHRLLKKTKKKINNKTMMNMIYIQIKKQPLVKNQDQKMKRNQKI